MSSSPSSSPSSSAPRPRWLYFAFYSWFSVTGGRFLAPFLEHEANLSDAMIGIILSIQYGIMSGLGPIYGAWADAQEVTYPHYGRARLLMVACTLGMIFFILHGLDDVLLWWMMIPSSSSSSSSTMRDATGTDELTDLPTTAAAAGVAAVTALPIVIPSFLLWFSSWQWHFLIQSGYACCLGFMFPVTDGMALDYLNRCTDGRDGRDYGKERLFGAITWGVTNFIYGIIMDEYGFHTASYPFAIVVTGMTVCIIYYYAHGQAQAQQAASGRGADMNAVDVIVVEPSRTISHEEETTSLMKKDYFLQSTTTNQSTTKMIHVIDNHYQPSETTKLISKEYRRYHDTATSSAPEKKTVYIIDNDHLPSSKGTSKLINDYDHNNNNNSNITTDAPGTTSTTTTVNINDNPKIPSEPNQPIQNDEHSNNNNDNNTSAKGVVGRKTVHIIDNHYIPSSSGTTKLINDEHNKNEASSGKIVHIINNHFQPSSDRSTMPKIINQDKDVELGMDNHPSPSSSQPSSYWSLVHDVMASPYGTAFMLSFFLLASGLSICENLVFLFFEFLGSSNSVCGATVAITVLWEIPIFQIAPQLLRTYGMGIMLLAANAAFIIRLIGYTLLPGGEEGGVRGTHQVMYLFLLESLHGVTFACSQAAAVEYVNQHMPLGAEASGQGIINLVRGSGSVLGLLSGGILQDRLGPRAMYRIFAITVTVGMSVFGVVHYYYHGDSPAAESTGTTATRRRSRNSMMSSDATHPTSAKAAAAMAYECFR